MEERSVPLIPIGQFSLLVRLTVRALRLYDRERLLTPAWVDPQSAYRYYSVEQSAVAETIRSLREVDLPLDEVRVALAEPGRLPAILEAHGHRLRLRVQEGQRALALLREMLEGAHLMPVLDHPIEIRELAPVRGAVLEQKTSAPQIPATLMVAFPRIGEVIRGAGLRGGHDFAVYPDDDYNPDDMTVIAGISLDVDTPANDEGVTSAEYGGGRCAVATLRGPYEVDGASRMTQAWNETWAWLAEHGHQRRAAAYERYVVGFGESNDPAEFVTEIVVPIA